MFPLRRPAVGDADEAKAEAEAERRKAASIPSFPTGSRIASAKKRPLGAARSPLPKDSKGGAGEEREENAGGARERIQYRGLAMRHEDLADFDRDPQDDEDSRHAQDPSPVKACGGETRQRQGEEPGDVVDQRGSTRRTPDHSLQAAVGKGERDEKQRQDRKDDGEDPPVSPRGANRQDDAPNPSARAGKALDVTSTGCLRDGILMHDGYPAPRDAPYGLSAP